MTTNLVNEPGVFFRPACFGGAEFFLELVAGRHIFPRLPDVRGELGRSRVVGEVVGELHVDGELLDLCERQVLLGHCCSGVDVFDGGVGLCRDWWGILGCWIRPSPSRGLW